MPRSSNQKLKLLCLAKIFYEDTDAEHAVTVKELIASLERYEIRAERKSIYDDIELLRVFGMDICTVRDVGVRYYLGKREFELAELKLLVDAVRSSKFITQKKSDTLIKKLERLAGRYEAMKLHRQLTLTNSLKADNEEIFCNVDMIHRAMAENRHICFRYFEWTPEKKRVLRHDGAFYKVSPWALTWDDENYYLVAYDALTDSIKHYRVDKMLELHIDSERREGREKYELLDMSQYAKQVFGMYGGEMTSVRLSCERSMAGIVFDRFGTDIVIANHGERFEFTVKVMASPTFYAWVLGFGKRVRVVYPDFVKDKIKELAHQALEE